MKARVIISLMLLLYLGSASSASAQTASTDIALDKGIWELSNNVIPDFHYSYDDYLHFAKILEFQTKAMIGYAWSPGILPTDSSNRQVGHAAGAGVSLGAGAALSLITGDNFKIKAFAELESMDLDRTQPWLSTLVIGFGTGWFW